MIDARRLKRQALLATVGLAALTAAFAVGVHAGRRLPAGIVISGGAGDTAIHYAPAENLEHIDVALIDQAKVDIDIAAYVLTDWGVIQALVRAADRGVAIRVYLDGGQIGSRDPTQPFLDLKVTPGVEIRTKQAHAPLMHFKSYRVDGRLLRTGSANFSPSGLKRQDNDLVVIENSAAAAEFKRNFETIWATAEAMR